MLKTEQNCNPVQGLAEVQLACVLTPSLLISETDYSKMSLFPCPFPFVRTILLVLLEPVMANLEPSL